MTRGFLGASAATRAILSSLAGQGPSRRRDDLLDDFDGGLCAWSVVEPLPVENLVTCSNDDCDGTLPTMLCLRAPSDLRHRCADPGSHCSLAGESAECPRSSPRWQRDAGVVAAWASPTAPDLTTCVGSRELLPSWCPYASGSCPSSTTCTV